MKPPPSWACANYSRHGEGAVCGACLEVFQSQGSERHGWEFPPRVEFGPGWVGYVWAHWFDATDENVFPSRDGRRLLAQAVCGSICDVTIALAPRADHHCGKCLRALRKAGRLVEVDPPRNDDWLD